MTRKLVPGDDLRAAEADLEAALAAFADELVGMMNVGEHRQANEIVATLEARFVIEAARL